MSHDVPYQPGDLVVARGVTYRVDELLGRGGMGFVLRALERELNDTVVLKFLRADCVKAHGDRFAREARVIRKIKDANVVTVERLGVTEDAHALPFYQMEYLAGRSLHDVRSHLGGKFDLGRGLNVMAQLASGLAAVHERGLVHRDIKPGNILLCRPGPETVVKIIDFGIVVLADEATDESFCGTPLWAAPEQLRGERCLSAADVFAAGLVIYEALTGHHAYADRKEYAHALGRAEQQAPPLTAFDDDFPPSLVRLVASALDLDPRKRPDALKLGIELRKIGGALAPIDVHEAVTDPGLGDGHAASPHTEVRPVTHADVGNPTDPDSDIPPWMAAMRAEHKRAEILGIEPRPIPVAAGAHGPHAHADTEPGRPPIVRVTVPMPRRPARDLDVTDPPSRELPGPAGKDRIAYLDAVPEPSPAPAAASVAPATSHRVASSNADRAHARSVEQPRRHWRLVMKSSRFGLVAGVFVATLVVGSAIYYVRGRQIAREPNAPASSHARGSAP